MVEAVRGVYVSVASMKMHIILTTFYWFFLLFGLVPLKNPEKTLVQVFFSRTAEPFWF
jgi:hypothetical protein